MTLGESHNVLGCWFRWCFVENEGAAFGMSLGGEYGKLILSLFRVVAIGALVWFLHHLRKQQAPTGVVVGFALILAGAIGNMVDIFYMNIQNENVASIFKRMEKMWNNALDKLADELSTVY